MNNKNLDDRIVAASPSVERDPKHWTAAPNGMHWNRKRGNLCIAYVYEPLKAGESYRLYRGPEFIAQLSTLQGAKDYAQQAGL